MLTIIRGFTHWIRTFGTEIIWSDPLEGSDGAIVLAKKIVSEDPAKWFYPDQYANPSNPLAHYHGTGPEILRDVGDQITHFVAGLGTSGTMMGTARRLKEHHRPIRCVAVERSLGGNRMHCWACCTWIVANNGAGLPPLIATC